MQPQTLRRLRPGATSGRTILGTLRDGELALKELTRFPNAVLRLGDHYHWNIFSLYEHLREGLRAAAREGVEISSVGIDTWGVDFAFVGRDGSLMGLPTPTATPTPTESPKPTSPEVLSREEVYAATGIQIMPFNSLYQRLYALQREHSSQLAAAHRLLFMPDALSYLLTGDGHRIHHRVDLAVAESPHETHRRRAAGADGTLAGASSRRSSCPGTGSEPCVRAWLPNAACRCCPSSPWRDTIRPRPSPPFRPKTNASPTSSSGTWSLMGIEVPDPVIDERTFACNFTNEGGRGGHDAPAEEYHRHVAPRTMSETLEGRRPRLLPIRRSFVWPPKPPHSQR